ncbi:MAG TPA: TylF/MycF/NovP-related O-methyltransferase [Cyclobacteriaceae bacterium]|nr:TylF/MycF/NovP-related O-methyltransferase [Cyclobacteriaceae bacterium]
MLHKLLLKAGYRITKVTNEEKSYPDLEKEFWNFYYACKPYTMTGVQRMYALYQSVHYIIKNKISGDFVECGVWKGGNPMIIAKVLQASNISDRTIFLYDTFEGMSEPTADDKNYKGKDAREMMDATDRTKADSVWCYSPLDEVQENMKQTGYPKDQVVFVKGKVEETIPRIAPAKIALLRLDTDWYESTYHELTHLFPLLSKKGVLIIDDYGYWEGCRKATDHYLEENQLALLLQRIDSTGRIALNF